MNNRLIDIEKLSRYHENLKNVLNTKEAAGEAAKAEAAAKKYADEEIAKLSFDEAGAAEAAAAQALQDAKDYADGKFQEKGSYEEAGAAAQALADAKADAEAKYQVKGSYEEAGAAAQALQDAKDYADGKFQVAGSYEEAGAAAQALDAAKEYTDGEIAKLSFDEAGTAKTLADAAEQNAKDYADGKFQEKGNYEVAGTAAGLNAVMDERVAKLEAIDHEKLATDASAAAVATVLDGAPEAFDTLKEVAEWIGNNDHATDVATLMTDVASLKAIDHEAYKGADETVLQSAKDYADGKFQVKGNYEEAGAAATAEQNAKDYADGKFQVAGNYETAGAAAQALVDAKAYVDGKGYATTAQVDAKQDTISDLEDIRSGAAAGATALQSVPAEYVTETELTGMGYLTADDLVFATDDEIDGLFA